MMRRRRGLYVVGGAVSLVGVLVGLVTDQASRWWAIGLLVLPGSLALTRILPVCCAVCPPAGWLSSASRAPARRSCCCVWCWTCSPVAAQASQCPSCCPWPHGTRRRRIC